MAEDPNPTPAEGKAFAAEKSASLVRFIVIVFNTVTYYWVLYPAGIPRLAVLVSVVANTYGLYHLVAQPYRRFPALTTTTWTTVTDGALITLWLAATGGFESPYYLLWYLSLVAVTLRYARTATWIAAGVYSLLYIGLVAVLDGLDGHYFDMSVRVVFILLQAGLGAQFAHETVEVFEERFRLKERMADAERFRTLAEAASEAMVIHEGDVIRDVNEAFLKMTGYDRAQIVGKSGMHIAAPEAQQSTWEWLEADPPVPMENWIVRSDGTRRLIRSRSRKIEYQGRPARVTTSLDITEERAAEEARQKAREREHELHRLKEMDRLKTDFLNAAAHELKTPLTPLRLQIHMLRRDGFQDKEKAARSVDILDRNLGRLSLLVEDMLDVARLESGRLDIDKEPTEIGELVGEAIETFQDLAEDRGVRLVYEKPASFVIPADAKRVTQILFNLLSNSLKFTPEGGTVQVKVWEQDHKAAIEVRDTGRGFEPEAAQRLFQPFSQLNDPVKHEGTGLGLYVSRGIAERHGGKLTGESPGPGKGAVFRVLLPAR